MCSSIELFYVSIDGTLSLPCLVLDSNYCLWPYNYILTLLDAMLHLVACHYAMGSSGPPPSPRVPHLLGATLELLLSLVILCFVQQAQDQIRLDLYFRCSHTNTLGYATNRPCLRRFAVDSAGFLWWKYSQQQEITRHVIATRKEEKAFEDMMKGLMDDGHNSR